jgi:hypothetical protein
VVAVVVVVSIHIKPDNHHHQLASQGVPRHPFASLAGAGV